MMVLSIVSDMSCLPLVPLTVAGQNRLKPVRDGGAPRAAAPHSWIPLAWSGVRAEAASTRNSLQQTKNTATACSPAQWKIWPLNAAVRQAAVAGKSTGCSWWPDDRVTIRSRVSCAPSPWLNAAGPLDRDRVGMAGSRLWTSPQVRQAGLQATQPYVRSPRRLRPESS